MDEFFIEKNKIGKGYLYWDTDKCLGFYDVLGNEIIIFNYTPAWRQALTLIHELIHYLIAHLSHYKKRCKRDCYFDISWWKIIRFLKSGKQSISRRLVS